VMTIQELLELMHEIAELTHTRVCLGIQVGGDGGGRTTSGRADDGTETSTGEFEPQSLKWDSTHEGNDKLCKTLRDRLLKYRVASDSPAPQLTIGSFKQFD